MKRTLRYFTLAWALGLVFTATASYADDAVLQEMENAFVRLHESVRPFVVNIDTRTKASGGPQDMDRFEDLFRFFGIPGPEGGMPNMPMPRRPMLAQGSGFIYDKQGHIITNNHVVDKAETITVKFWNGRELDAKVVGTDPDTDLAVIKVEADFDLPVATLGDSDALKVGQFAIAVGSPRGFEGSFSFGHISALGREELQLPGLRFQNFIQTDAAINLGNSGGPLCNLRGEVIGINIAIVYGANSLGFAIPSDTAKQVVPSLITEGKVTRGYLGVGITNVDPYAEALSLPDKSGAFVKTVQPGTPAEQAGLKPYDVIREVDGRPVGSAAELVRRISDLAPGSKATLKIWRDGKLQDMEVSLSEYAGSVAAVREGKTTLGLQIKDLSPEMATRLQLKPDAQGALVVNVEPGSPAEEAGFNQGDVITEVAQKAVTNAETFRKLVAENGKPGKGLLIGYIRAGGEHDITIIKIPKEGFE